MEIKFRLLKDYESPTMIIKAGVTKTEKAWMEIFPGLEKGGCSVKTDWFKNIGWIDASKTLDRNVKGLEARIERNFLGVSELDSYNVYVTVSNHDEALLLQKIISNIVS